MNKKIGLLLAVVIATLALTPATGQAWYRHGPSRYYGNHYYHGGGDAWAWGLTGLVLGGAIVAAASQPAFYAPPYQTVVYAPPYQSVVYAPPPQTVVYAQPAASVYNYPPSVPPGMCRWERYVLDGYGRTVLDQNGQPVREYTLGSCQSPPY